MGDNLMAVDSMREARELIKAKRYNEARAILVKVDDPRAQQWLEQLDNIAPTASQHPLAAESAPREQYVVNESPIQAESADFGPVNLVMAVIGGIVGAVIGGIIWAAIAVITDYEIGYVAVGVGALAGGGVVIANGGKRGLPYQLIAVVTGVAGIFAGKFLAGVYFYREVLIEDYGIELVNEIGIGGLVADTVQLFPDYLSATLQPIDLLFVVLAIVAAWRIPALRREQSAAPASATE
jgi:hypothetical protein